MVELTEREKKIIHAMNVMRNPQLYTTPPETKKDIIIMTLKIRGMVFDESEIIDLIYAVNDEVNLSVANGLGLLNRFAPMLKGIDKLKFP